MFEERIVGPLERAAYGAYQIAASNMMRAIEAVSTERGRGPRDYALFAFGGNGPVFAATMAQALPMSRIVVPPSPGLFSSFLETPRAGPVIIEEYDTTCVVPPRAKAALDAYGNIVIDLP